MPLLPFLREAIEFDACNYLELRAFCSDYPYIIVVAFVISILLQNKDVLLFVILNAVLNLAIKMLPVNLC